MVRIIADGNPLLQDQCQRSAVFIDSQNYLGVIYSMQLDLKMSRQNRFTEIDRRFWEQTFLKKMYRRLNTLPIFSQEQSAPPPNLKGQIIQPVALS